MSDDPSPDEPGEPVEMSTDRVWKLGQVRLGRTQMDWGPDAKDHEPDDQ